MEFKELEQEQKNKVKEQRLHQYRVQIYNLELDILAYKAIKDEQSAKLAEANIKALKDAYAAVAGDTEWVH